jgi:hypothetical protein
MGSRKRTLHILGVSVFKRLTGIYPDRFRRQYAGEVFGVLVQGLEEAGASGGEAMPAFILRESGALVVSIIREHWHERQRLKEGQMEGEERLYREIRKTFLKRRLKRAARVVLLLAALIPLFYGCMYAYAGIQIAQAKQLGVHPTLEDAVQSVYADGEHGGAKVKLVYINRAGPCFPYGRLPFVWCVTLSVFYDRPPEGSERSVQGGYSTYYHLREGWVFMQEMIPGLTGVIMERFGMVGEGD